MIAAEVQVDCEDARDQDQRSGQRRFGQRCEREQRLRRSVRNGRSDGSFGRDKNRNHDLEKSRECVGMAHLGRGLRIGIRGESCEARQQDASESHSVNSLAGRLPAVGDQDHYDVERGGVERHGKPGV